MGRGRYSPDLIRQAAQRLYDRRRGGYVEPGRFRDPSGRAIRHTARRFAFGEEQLRRVNRAERMKLMEEAKPKSGRFRADAASADIVSQAVQRVIQHPESFFQDLPAYRALLNREAESGKLTSVQLKANRAMLSRSMRRSTPATPRQWSRPRTPSSSSTARSSSSSRSAG